MAKPMESCGYGLWVQLSAWNLKPWTYFHVVSHSKMVNLGILVMLVHELGQSDSYSYSMSLDHLLALPNIDGNLM